MSDERKWFRMCRTRKVMLVPGDFDILRTDFRSDYTFILCALERERDR